MVESRLKFPPVLSYSLAFSKVFSINTDGINENRVGSWHENEFRAVQKGSQAHLLIPAIMGPLTVLTGEWEGLGTHSRAVVVKCDHASRSLEGLLKHRLLGPTPELLIQEVWEGV